MKLKIEIKPIDVNNIFFYKIIITNNFLYKNKLIIFEKLKPFV